MRKPVLLLAASVLLPIVTLGLVVLYAVYFPPANANVGWPLIYGALLVGAVLAAFSQRGKLQRVVAAAVYLAAAWGVLWFTVLDIACRLFADCL